MGAYGPGSASPCQARRGAATAARSNSHGPNVAFASSTSVSTPLGVRVPDASHELVALLQVADSIDLADAVHVRAVEVRVGVGRARCVVDTTGRVGPGDHRPALAKQPCARFYWDRTPPSRSISTVVALAGRCGRVRRRHPGCAVHSLTAERQSPAEQAVAVGGAGLLTSRMRVGSALPFVYGGMDHRAWRGDSAC